MRADIFQLLIRIITGFIRVKHFTFAMEIFSLSIFYPERYLSIFRLLNDNRQMV